MSLCLNTSLDLEWKVIYVGNAEDSSCDQTLEEVMVGPVPVGINRFVLQANAPNPNMISNQDLIGVTVILITCSFMDHKFVQIGYYVNNEYSEPYEPENPPNPVEISKLYRNILHDQPRVTRFAIDWTGGNNPLAADGTTATEGGDEKLEVQDMEEEGEGDEDEEEEEDDEEGEGEDENVEIDLDEDDDDEEEEEGEEGEEGDSESEEVHMQVLNDDSNSMDVERMLQQAN